MNKLTKLIMVAIVPTMMACCGSNEGSQASEGNAVVENIMARRSIRSYQEQPVEKETMEAILKCGINAPNGKNMQSWAIRVVDNPEFINGMTELFVQAHPRAAERPGFKNMFVNAPTVVFIASSPEYNLSVIDCGLLAENMCLAAWSMGVGSCILGGPAAFVLEPQCAPYYEKLQIPEGYSIQIAIAFGYPEGDIPEAKPRDESKIMFID